MTLDIWFHWSGVTINALAACVALLFVWVWFIWPFVEACSLTRCYLAAMGKHAPAGWLTVLKLLSYSYLEVVFGRDFTAKSSHKFRWEGVGKWVVYHGDKEDQ